MMNEEVGLDGGDRGSCLGKIGYETKAAALDAIRQIERRTHRRGCKKKSHGRIRDLNCYRCAHCHGWHVGSNFAGRRERIERARKREQG